MLFECEDLVRNVECNACEETPLSILFNVTGIIHQADRICSVDNKKNVAFQPKGKVETIGTKCHLVD